jgi:lysozyme family protein/peptidoglycan hydrolase-like protein with peptidoglycan-binding domain
MAKFNEYKDQYERLWSGLTIRPGREVDAKQTADKLLDAKTTYQEVERRTGVPWWFVGLCHYRESNFDFETYLGNGQPLSRQTTRVPKGRGPFTGPNAFADGAVDALRLEGFVGASDWSIARVLYRLEGFNGYGYHYKGVNSPYLYGGSTAYGPPESAAGKYVRDHVFDPDFVDTQLGTAVVLKALVELDPGINLGGGGGSTAHEPEDDAAHSILWLQQSLNKLGADPRLAEDGRNGPKTMAAVSLFQQESGLDDTGLADAATIAGIERKLSSSATGGVDTLVQVTDRLERMLDRTRAAEVRFRPAVTETTASLEDLAGVAERLLSVIQKAQGGAASAGQPTQPADQIRKALELLGSLLVPSTDGKTMALGQVNGALGQTIGALLNGKKTAIGLTGSVLTSLLSQVPAATGLGQVLAMLTPAAGLSPYTMPIFIGLAVWGVLGKLEKWAQGTAPPPTPPK